MSTPPSASRRKVAILGGNRTPFARSNREYANASNQDMLTAAINGLVARTGLQDVELGMVAAGAVIKHSRDFNLTRESVLGSALAPTTPAIDVQQACGTGLAAAVLVADGITAGRYDAAIAGGTDTISDAPLMVSDPLRRTLIKLSHARSASQRLKLVGSIRPNQLVPESPANFEPRTGLSMGEHAAITAREFGITREDQDALALASHQKLAAAYDAGFFNDLITPFLGVTKDTNLRPDSTMESLAKLKPVFGKQDAIDHGAQATMTAGNSTTLTDGASVALLGTEEFAATHGLTPWAYLVDSETAAVDYVHGPDGLLMAPTYAVPRLLARNGLTLQDFDFYEIHEAFASQVLATLQAWESEDYCRDRLGLKEALGPIDASKLNVKGSSLAAGHPFAATGARVLATAAKTLHENGGGRALISICAAGGQGIAAILEA
ncbi:acetyl-CoA C-acetyltransferase [Corynebacterium sp. 153RC1]|uniref:acetyl-CoA C-acetyltransferase n=1 Tax=unclassified Corynebacterium TaxID=2624378 RepID=UPI00211C8FB0|nr:MULTISPECIES: acetyl-CoA C-acetyltransferase [unclassified Corynebacterium]MCQ9370910.1 acetyl-CoA C-acetyltransferase [Corynebacterium sp. 35RC1]MCQ9353105.1 acetyl-CoA C-acetyltransferase [Corynebacterium sp. 209RC1]MCQ9355309.1 acetyl-CoA C-acetyltransferase [Corynebacterium sp. 1222RC1]MCQ9357596.1 acetyl-CoA C-acetyltransferase [Corynebacterium sp. 122RC1]MCQ9359206.1 acetyl-CoA C-acetyltransferase [Corynebacterium sp. 142RC1]